MSLLGTQVDLELGRPADGGGFVGRLEDGRVVFVRHGLSGERVRATITEEHARWARADAIEIIEASPDRVTPPCPHAGPSGCGGCDYQHIALSKQRHLKSELLADQLRRVAGLDLHVAVEALSDTGLGTRTRVRFGITPFGALGMRRRHSRDLVEVETCLLGVPTITSLDLSDRDWPPGDDLQVVALNGVDEATIALVEWSDDDNVEDAATGEAGELLDDDIGAQWTEVGDIALRVSADSFFQIHTRAPEVLVATVLQSLDPQEGDVILDLYSGVGLFTVPIADRIGTTGMVIGIEASPAAAEDARINLEDRSQARVVEATVTQTVLAPYLANAQRAVIDPPRSGVDKRALRAIAQSSLQRIVMVSCNPSTFARDLKVLLDEGWKLDVLRAFDLFEMTEHLEVVATLSR